jgi:predicted CoA-binding protein
VDDARLRTILATSPTVAVLGIRDDPAAAGFYVPEYLHDVGYRVLGVNPGLAGRMMFGEPVRASLGEITDPIDMVDVFRRADQLHLHLDELIAARPRVVWFQQGIRNDRVASQLEAAGIEVVQDRCTLSDHQRLRVGAPRSLNG